jgi:hypothetical protein
LDVELVRVIDRALAFERRKRWPNARAMSAALAAATRHLGGADAIGRTPVLELQETAPEMEVPSRPGTPARAGARWRLALIVALVLGAAFLAMRFAAHPDVQAKDNAPMRLPVSAAVPVPAELPSAAASTAAPLGPRAVSPATVHAPAPPISAHPNPKANSSAHAAPNARSASPADPAADNKNPLFFPTQ